MHGGQPDVIFLGFAKAFDRVSNQKLLHKLRCIITNENTFPLARFLSYKYTVVCKRWWCFLAWIICVIGCAPRISYGPLLFLIFINNLKIDNPSVQCRVFADDFVFFCSAKSLSDQESLNRCLSSVHSWCTKWNMVLNSKKCVQMTVTRKSIPVSFSHCINTERLVSVDQFLHLCVLITSNLNWNAHVNYIAKKAMQKLWFLIRNLCHCTSETKLTGYKTIIRPILEYAAVVWDPH